MWTRRLRILSGCVAAGLVLAACGGSTHHPSPPPPPSTTLDPAFDVSVTACQPDGQDGLGHATVEVTNTGTNTATYLGEVRFVSPGAGTFQFDAVGFTVPALAPGAQSDDQVSSVKAVPAGAQCKVAQVTRF